MLWSWILGASSIAVYWLIGDKNRWAWPLGIASEIAWAAYAVIYRQWGFLICAFFFAAVFWRNWRKWQPGKI